MTTPSSAPRCLGSAAMVRSVSAAARHRMAYTTALDPLAKAGASLWIDRGVRIAHAKTMVIDRKVTLMNWSSGAARNSEDLNLVISPEVADTYAAHWRQRLAASVPFTGREGCG